MNNSLHALGQEATVNTSRLEDGILSNAVLGHRASGVRGLRFGGSGPGSSFHFLVVCSLKSHKVSHKVSLVDFQARIEALRACEDWAQLEEEWTRQWLGGNSEFSASFMDSFRFSL